LVDAYSQGNAHLFVKLQLRSTGKVPDQVVELRLKSQTPKHEIFSKSGVAGFKAGRFGSEQIGCVTASVYTLENVKRDVPRGSNG
jgi:hypothetical protein